MEEEEINNIKHDIIVYKGYIHEIEQGGYNFIGFLKNPKDRANIVSCSKEFIKHFSDQMINVYNYKIKALEDSIKV